MFKVLLLTVLINCSIAAKSQLDVNECLNINESIESPNLCFQLLMQPDGNLVIYHRHTGEPLWSTATSNTCTSRACMQDDGNFVTYCDNRPTWASGTPGWNGGRLFMQDDGNAVIYDNNKAIWSSGSDTKC